MNHIDRSGREIVPGDGSTAALLATIAANPTIGAFVDQLAMAKDFTVYAQPSPPSSTMTEAGGGRFEPFAGDPGYSAAWYTLEDPNAGPSGSQCKQDWPLDVLAHELGHAYALYDYNNGGAVSALQNYGSLDAYSNAMAVYFQNAVTSGPVRLGH